MADIALSLIKPNPFRDFDLHPIDPEQVERLRLSINADTFWSSVIARKAGDNYEIAFGHHRIEAARAARLDSVPIEVRELSDWQMVRLLAAENATQRGTTAAASLDAIAAISKVLAFGLFRYDENGFSKIFENMPGYAEMLGRLGAGSGIGEPSILKATTSFTTAQVRNAIGVLKDSGRMAAIITEARVRAEMEIAAEQRRNPVAATPPAKPRKVKFDAKAARLFKLDSHLAEFRRIVTDDAVQSFLPVDQQYAFAQSIIEGAGDGELTAIKLREQANKQLYEGAGVARSRLRNSPKRPTDHRIKDGIDLLRRGVHSIKQGCVMLAGTLDDNVELSDAALERINVLMDEIADAMELLMPAKRKRATLRVIKGGGAA